MIRFPAPSLGQVNKIHTHPQLVLTPKEMDSTQSTFHQCTLILPTFFSLVHTTMVSHIILGSNKAEKCKIVICQQPQF